MASPDDDLLRRLDKRLTIGEGLRLATDPPTRYFTKDQELLREARARIAQMAQELEDERSTFTSFSEHHAATEAQLRAAEARGDTLADTARAWERRCSLEATLRR